MVCPLDVMVEVAGGNIGWVSVSGSEMEDRAKRVSCVECAVAVVLVDACAVDSVGSMILGSMTTDNPSLLLASGISLLAFD